VLVDEALEAAEAAAAAAEAEKAAAKALDEFYGGMGDGMGAAGPSESAEGEGVPERWRRLAPGPCATLAAAVEISFTESTRSKDIAGLDPPPERPYLCNMAVATTMQRRGLGSAVLIAAEDLVRAVGDDTVYLHLRFKDAPAAALYRAAGYESVAQDSIFVRLIGQERRWLMKKSLKNEE
jgi:GNAT superfamily N-acetyltransferase